MKFEVEQIKRAAQQAIDLIKGMADAPVEFEARA